MIIFCHGIHRGQVCDLPCKRHFTEMPYRALTGTRPASGWAACLIFLDQAPQRIVDASLVTRTLGLEEFQDILIKADGCRHLGWGLLRPSSTPVVRWAKRFFSPRWIFRVAEFTGEVFWRFQYNSALHMVQPCEVKCSGHRRHIRFVPRRHILICTYKILKGKHSVI